jgi:hypothetical protein
MFHKIPTISIKKRGSIYTIGRATLEGARGEK